jgi:hypothetical protein
MLALTIVATKNRKHRFAFHVGFNPTQLRSYLIMNMLRASVDDPDPSQGRRLVAHPPCPQDTIRT